MRKIWAFFWYQNLRKFEKNLNQSDRAPLRLWLMSSSPASRTSKVWNDKATISEWSCWIVVHIIVRTSCADRYYKVCESNNYCILFIHVRISCYFCINSQRQFFVVAINILSTGVTLDYYSFLELQQGVFFSLSVHPIFLDRVASLADKFSRQYLFICLWDYLININMINR